MKITWLGHSGFRIEIAGQVLLLDPWLRGNPVFDESRFDEAIAGATAVLVSHGHADHSANACEIAKKAGCPVYGIYDWITWVADKEGVEGVGFNKGGTVRIGDVAATMVNAAHSSSVSGDDGPIYTGCESGFMIAGEGETLYFAGDTDVMADMALFQELHRPTIGILPIGGHFTMDPARAAFACKKFFNFKVVIPCHYKTFPLLEQSAEEFARAIAPTPVKAPEVMGSVEV